MENSFFTFCRHCGRQILMVRNLQAGYWTACEPTVMRFGEGNAERFVDSNGYHRNGTRNTGSVIGYKEHRRVCA